MRYILVIQLVVISLNIYSNPTKDTTTIKVKDLNYILDCVKESRKDLERTNDSLLKVIKEMKR